MGKGGGGRGSSQHGETGKHLGTKGSQPSEVGQRPTEFVITLPMKEKMPPLVNPFIMLPNTPATMLAVPVAQLMPLPSKSRNQGSVGIKFSMPFDANPCIVPARLSKTPVNVLTAFVIRSPNPPEGAGGGVAVAPAALFLIPTGGGLARERVASGGDGATVAMGAAGGGEGEEPEEGSGGDCRGVAGGGEGEEEARGGGGEGEGVGMNPVSVVSSSWRAGRFTCREPDPVLAWSKVRTPPT